MTLHTDFLSRLLQDWLSSVVQSVAALEGRTLGEEHHHNTELEKICTKVPTGTVLIIENVIISFEHIALLEIPYQPGYLFRV